jgi:LEA14-like dessication related protein
MRDKLFLLFVLIFITAGCAPFLPGFETPTVTVTSFRVLPGHDAVPTFEIGLHIINPNRTELKLEGISYAVELEGHKILSGASNKLPVIDPYGERDVRLQVQPDLLSTINLFADLLNQPRNKFRFDLTASLDVGVWVPRIKVHQEGFFSLPKSP